jgi:hypothetical protein
MFEIRTHFLENTLKLERLLLFNEVFLYTKLKIEYGGKHEKEKIWRK